VRAEQLDRVKFHFSDLERGAIAFDCMAADVAALWLSPLKSWIGPARFLRRLEYFGSTITVRAANGYFNP
jgi:hypothetical protein